MALFGQAWGLFKPLFAYRPWGVKNKEKNMDKVLEQKMADKQSLVHLEKMQSPSATVIETRYSWRWWYMPDFGRWIWRFPKKDPDSSTAPSVEADSKPTELSGTTFSAAPVPPDSTPLPKSARWDNVVLPEHYEICFNFLRHLFDMFVVGFLCASSPVVRVILDIFGLKGALKLWLHGMVLFLVSTVGMAFLLWVVQTYLPQFALIYGVVQALVISVSVRQRYAIEKHNNLHDTLDDVFENEGRTEIISYYSEDEKSEEQEYELNLSKTAFMDHGTGDTILYKSAKNWENAQAYCRSLNMDLVMVRSSEENSKLLTLSERNSAWIGLRFETVSNIWKWINGEEAQFTNWESKEPKVRYDKENCATIEMELNHQGKWSAMPCEEQNPFICSNGVTNNTVTGTLYLVLEEKMWQEASWFCRTHYTDLASITDSQIQGKVEKTIKDEGSRMIWIGLRWNFLYSSWFWANGDQFNYSNFEENVTVNRDFKSCVAVHKEIRFKWSNECCKSRFHFLCFEAQ
ncbi:LY75 protein, partial [Polypterus senegalus]